MVTVSPVSVVYNASYEDHTNASVLNETAAAPSRTALGTALIIIQSVIFTLALGGNLIAITVLILYRRKRRKFSRMHLFILHLCVADVAVALFNVAPNLCLLISYPQPCPFQNSTQTCKATHYFSIVVIYGSTYVLVMTAIDRFLAICHPFTAQRLADSHVHMMAGLAWVLSFIFSIPQALVFDFHETDMGSGCDATWHEVAEIHKYYKDVYMAWFACAVWIIPTIIIAVCYISLTAVVWNRSGAILSRGSNSSNKPMLLRRKSATMSRTTNQSRLMKPVRLTLAVIIGYILCWSPWMVSMMIQTYQPDQQRSPTGKRKLFLLYSHREQMSSSFLMEIIIIYLRVK